MTLGYNDLLQASDRQHLMLLYGDEVARNATEIDCVNKALKAGQFCVYASVDMDDKSHMLKLAASIQGYGRHVKEGNLLVVNFMPFYASALKGDLTPFGNLKAQIEAALRDRVASGKSGKALIVADAACNLTKHGHFGQSAMLESWWQNTYVEWARSNQDITIICAHPSWVLERAQEKSRIAGLHSLSVDLHEFSQVAIRSSSTKAYAPTKTRPIRILVAEPELDIQAVYKAQLRLLPVDLVVVPDGRRCLEQALMTEEIFDTIIIDSHLQDLGGIEVAKKILEEKSDQSIVITTTRDLETIRAHLRSESFNADTAQVLIKPFRFSQLLSLIKPAKQTV